MRKSTASLSLLLVLPLLALLPGCKRKQGGSPGATAGQPAQTTVVIQPARTSEKAWPFEKVLRAEGLGPLRLGMTPDQVKTAFGGAVLIEATGDRGLHSLEFHGKGGREVTLLFDQPSESGPLKSEARLLAILAEHPDFSTPEGIGPTQPLAKAEAAYGKLLEIRRQELSGIELVRFQRGPAWLDIYLSGVEGPAGEYEEGKHTTTSVKEGARIHLLGLRK